MLDTFKARLKAKLKAAGVNLSSKRIDAYADRLHKKNPDVKEDSEHDTLIDELDELVSFADIAKQDDTIRDLGGKLKKQEAAKPPVATHEDEETDDEEDDEEDETKGKKKTKPETGKKKPGSKMPEWFKPYAEQIETQNKEKLKATIDSMIAKKNKGEDGKPKISEKVLARMQKPEKVEDLDEWWAEIESELGDVSTSPEDETTNKNPVSSHKPSRSSGKGDKVSDKELDSIVSNIM